MPRLAVVPLQRLPRSINQIYTYESATGLPVGQLVKIPWRSKIITGVVVKDETVVGQPYISGRLKKISDLSPFGKLSATQLNLINSLESKFAATPTLAHLTVVGKLPEKIPNVAQIFPRFIKSPARQTTKLSPPKPGQAQQIVGLASIAPSTDWLNFFRKITKNKAQSLCLWPDKNSLLTAYEFYRFYFKTTLWTSDQSLTERGQAWQAIHQGEAQLIFGTRSGIFAPFKNLCQIVIFDANNSGHRASDEQPHYAIPDLALDLKKLNVGITLVSDGPSVMEKVDKFLFSRRPTTAAKMTIINRAILPPTERPKLMADSTIDQLSQPTKSWQLILINKLGLGILICQDCWRVVACPNCQANLTGQLQNLFCKQCLTSHAEPKYCEHCQGSRFKLFGLGLEGILKFLQNEFPERQIIKFDAASLGKPVTTAALIKKINTTPNLIVVATSALLTYRARLTRPNVTVLLQPEIWLSTNGWNMNVILWDLLAKLQNFTAKNLIIDTNLADSPTLKFYASQDVAGWLKQETIFRQQFFYPPFSSLLNIVADRELTSEVLTKYLPTGVSPARLQGNQAIFKLPLNYRVNDFIASLPPTWKIDINPPIV